MVEQKWQITERRKQRGRMSWRWEPGCKGRLVELRVQRGEVEARRQA